jgi:aerobic carbon-monoxide dehydrogenase medium subunit
MVSAPFGYVTASSYEEAAALLHEHGDDAKILAGGQSLMPMLNLRLARPSLLIDINAADQRAPSVDRDVLRLPALTRHHSLTEHELVRRHCPLLADAVRHLGNARVRNRGTIGGSLAHADPTAEIGACALAVGAGTVVRGPGGQRAVPVSDLFVTYLTTTLEQPEVITDVLIPVTRPRQGWAFHEMVRRTSDFAIVAVAVWLELDPDADVIRTVRVALAGVADRVVLADQGTLAGLRGTRADGPAVEQAAAALSDSVSPGSDVHASADYRRRLVRVLGARALQEAFGRAARPAGAAA